MEENDGSLRYRRPLLKLSGEMLGGESGNGFDRAAIELFAQDIKKLVDHGITPAIVLGGGNFFRGARGHLPNLRRHRADFIGMLATMMNAICFADHLTFLGIKTEVFSTLETPKVCEPYQVDRARACLSDGVVCLFAGGTGAPFFSTDTGAALRAIESDCDVLIKATKVDGVYDKDPMVHSDAIKFEEITYEEVLWLGLRVMDPIAIALCRENHMPLKVLSLSETDSLLKACLGKKIGTVVTEE